MTDAELAITIACFLVIVFAAIIGLTVQGVDDEPYQCNMGRTDEEIKEIQREDE
jgi:hypothetical protein